MITVSRRIAQYNRERPPTPEMHSLGARYGDPLPRRACLRYAGQHCTVRCSQPKLERTHSMDPNALIALLIGLVVLVVLLGRGSY